MPNGGHACCRECGYLEITDRKRWTGVCRLFGTPATAVLLCRHFHIGGHPDPVVQGGKPMFEELEPGVIYEIDNDTYKAGNPRPKYRVSIVPYSGADEGSQ